MNLFAAAGDKSMKPGDTMTNSSLVTADRATHLKIVVVSLIASLGVLVAGIAARPQVDTGATIQVVKAGKSLLAARADTPTIR